MNVLLSMQEFFVHTISLLHLYKPHPCRTYTPTLVAYRGDPTWARTRRARTFTGHSALAVDDGVALTLAFSVKLGAASSHERSEIWP